jgi:hypothetical protein
MGIMNMTDPANATLVLLSMMLFSAIERGYLRLSSNNTSGCFPAFEINLCEYIGGSDGYTNMQDFQY